MAKDGDLQHPAIATLTRVAVGFGAGVAAGTIVGAITGYSTFLSRLLDPTLQALRAIPSIAWVPLFILWLGIFEASKITLIAVGVFFPVYLGVMGASQGLGYLLIDGQQLGKPAQIVTAIVAFAILGKITDWLIVAATRPFLRWEDRFARQGAN